MAQLDPALLDPDVVEYSTTIELNSVQDDLLPDRIVRHRLNSFRDTDIESELSYMIFAVPYDENEILQAFPANGYFRFSIAVDGLSDPGSVRPELTIRWYTI